MQSIAVFNNKGGVGKTTLLCNLAAYIALHEKKKVLIVDADPQCNATQSLFSDKVIDDIYDRKNSFTIYSVVQPLSVGKGYTKDVEVKKSEEFGVDIIVGDPRLSLTEDLLAKDWGTAISGDTRGLRTTFLFSQLLSKLRDYDYVFFDVGPSLGSINRAVLIGCDYFISPMSIDIFSLKAIENISVSIDLWKKKLDLGLQHNTDPDDLPDFHEWRIKFAGYITHQYIAKMDGRGERRAVNAYEKIMKRVPKIVQDEFVDKLQSNYSDLDYELGSVPNLHSLIPMSQTSRKPIFELKARDGVVGAHFTKVRDAFQIFSGIAERLHENLLALND